MCVLIECFLYSTEATELWRFFGHVFIARGKIDLKNEKTKGYGGGPNAREIWRWRNRLWRCRGEIWRVGAGELGLPDEFEGFRKISLLVSTASSNYFNLFYDEDDHSRNQLGHGQDSDQGAHEEIQAGEWFKKEFSYNKILKDLRNETGCNGIVVQAPQLGQLRYSCFVISVIVLIIFLTSSHSRAPASGASNVCSIRTVVWLVPAKPNDLVKTSLHGFLLLNCTEERVVARIPERPEEVAGSCCRETRLQKDLDSYRSCNFLCLHFKHSQVLVCAFCLLET
ncbi:Protein translation factor SUI1 homolog 2 [Striga hermonthica]|uniref:Protein translation factor SUI1 homolog 2 n=1 Tax=Striga hermonthica TaxID=68872 RepID=A0A9N7P260_STRHE|nr:Protein translation factor SUI1 homolog 2 [Striga hermonthica]